MQVCFITPTPLLRSIATKSERHLVLAHQFLVDKDYEQFYRTIKRLGDYVILDNSAYELGASVEVSKLVRVASRLQPNAIFLPDKRFDTEATLQMVVEAIKALTPLCRGIGAKLFAVPQGSNLAEILHCYDELCKLPIDGFGLYEEIGEVSGLGRRWDFLKYLQETNRVKTDKYYHLLGMEEDVQNIRRLAQFEWVDSIDSVKPISYGLSGIQFHPEKGPLAAYPHRQKDYFNQGFGAFEDIVKANCDLTLKWAQK